MTKRVGIIGSGDAGRALASGFARHGWSVVVGTREPKKLEEWAAEQKGVRVGSPADAAESGDVVVLATAGDGTENAIDLAGRRAFAGKLVLDATNPLDFSEGMPPGLFVGTTDSLGERVQRKLPDAKVVKCFNTVSNGQMVDPNFAEGIPPMLICGNDPEAKKRAEAILQELGWPGAFDLGDIAGSRWLEALVPLWVRVAFVTQDYGHAFKVVR